MVKTPPRRVLDVGCFCGGSGRWLKERFPEATFVGIEMLPEAAAMAREVYDKVIESPFEEVDLEAEGLTEGSLDAIIAADVLEHMVNPWAALIRLKPLLAPGGFIYISLPNVRNLAVLADLAEGNWRYEGAGILDVTHLRFFTRTQALEMLEETGWHLDHISYNLDPQLHAALGGKPPKEINSLSVGRLQLDKLTHVDVIELLSVQFFLRARPS
jgi:trans-aconitate methyltransferase